jgi:outer membrane protein TolC
MPTMFARTAIIAALFAAGLGSLGGAAALAQNDLRRIIIPEEPDVSFRDPTSFAPAPLPAMKRPRTVIDERYEEQTWMLTLDESIRVSLENGEVIRVLAGVTATTSGSTIYDASIVNPSIEQAKSRFDPRLIYNGTHNRNETPNAFIDPGDPTQAIITGPRVDSFNHQVGLRKTNVLGGEWNVAANSNPTRFNGLGPFPLNPRTGSDAELSYTQPLLQGAGFYVNTAPIVIARLNTERSYFQMKDSTQEMTRGVIEGYWNLVFARTNLWARRVQLQLAEQTYLREKARQEIAGLADLGDVAQSRVTFAQFKANAIAAEATVLSTEAALRNILGLPPEDSRILVPCSPPTNERLVDDWDSLLALTEQRRPDIIELKIVYEADQQRLLQARNQMLPTANAVALYRWNGLEGDMPNGAPISTGAGQYTDWALGINFSVPLGYRNGRATVRQQELQLARDQANIRQSVHAAVHQVAATVRNIDSQYEQYLAYKETREAASENLELQLQRFRVGRVIFLNVLQALNDWGNAVSNEALAITNYNVALATLERQTGTILETHGVVFVEERFQAAGPLLLFGPDRCYSRDIRPAEVGQRYPSQTEPSEEYFELKDPAQTMRTKSIEIPEMQLPPPRSSSRRTEQNGTLRRIAAPANSRDAVEESMPARKLK